MKYFVLTLITLNYNVLYSCGTASLELSQLEQYQGVKYFTYTRNNRTNALDIRDVNFNDTYVNVFIIHGFASKSLDKSVQVKNDLFQYNINVERVIIVSWMDYSHDSDSSLNTSTVQQKYYEVVQYHVPLLAQDLYEKIVHIRENGAQTIELVGHSIGAHIAGQSGKLLRQKIGFTVDQIFGLDPAGRYFEGKPSLALGNGDAKNVVVLHTNINVYGFKSQIGSNDIKVNGGERQPNCKVKINFCSHNEAWNSYSQYLKNKIVNEKKTLIHPYVICLDVSFSMKWKNRLTNAVHSTKQIISNAKTGTYLGIVKFYRYAEKVHDIVQIKSEVEKNSLRASLPRTNSGGTSIGDGLRFSMNMLKAMLNTTNSCARSTIVLISDGSQNTGESPKDVSKDLQDACISVSSIGVGLWASEDLEEISATTGGEVSYVMEDGTSQEMFGMAKAFSYMFDSESSDNMTVHLPSKQIILTDGDNDVHFIIDENIGRDTEFKFVSIYVDKIDVKLTSPDGEMFTSASLEYFRDPFAGKGFRIPQAEPGQWNLTLTKISKGRRSVRSVIDAIATGTTHQLIGKVTTRLNGIVSNRILEYPNSITVSGELRSGEFPIIYSEVFAVIQGPNEPAIRLPLYDDGVFPDELQNDGIYTNNIVKLPRPGRYSVILTARSNDTAMLVPKEIDYFLKDVIDCKQMSCQQLNKFERETDVGSIKLLSNVNVDKIPPRLVADLRGMIQNWKQKLIALEWTSPSDEFYDIKVKSYEIRALINDTTFENGLTLDGSLNSDNLTTAHKKRILIKIPDHIWNAVVKNVKSQNLSSLRFALKSIGFNNAISERSNIVSVIVKENGMTSASTRPRSGLYQLIPKTAKLLEMIIVIVVFFI